MTPDDIDRRLPRVATWPPKLYDLTDAAEREEAVAWLYGLLSDISRPTDDNRGGNRNEACTVQLNGKWYTPDDALALLNQQLDWGNA